MDTTKDLPDFTPPEPPLLPGAVSTQVKPVEQAVEDRTKIYTDRAIEVIVMIMNDEHTNKRTRLDAANMLLDRAWGKATVKHEVPAVVTLQDTLRMLDEKDKRFKAKVKVIEPEPEPIYIDVVPVKEEIDWGESI